MEISPYEENVEKDLHLLKIIAFTSLNNLTFIANQKAMIKFFEIKSKFPSNEELLMTAIQFLMKFSKNTGTGGL